jgi:membrane protein implicated in regulation of membrane protease activity
MNASMMWLVLTGILVAFELFTGTFYVLMIAVGMAFGAAVAALGFNTPVQVLVAAVVGVIATGLLHRSRLGRPVRQDSARDRNVNLDIGEKLTIDTWNNGKARCMYRGAMWDIDLAHGAVPIPGAFTIVEVQGSRLVVANT